MAFTLVSEAQNRDRNRDRDDREPNGRKPNGQDRPRKNWGRRLSEKFQKKIFDDSFYFTLLYLNPILSPRQEPRVKQRDKTTFLRLL